MPQLLIRTLDVPADNLALDEALLVAAEAGQTPPVLRLWQFPQTTAVLGRGSRVGDEINLSYCRQHQIPVLRRCSGGASVVGGPGCLMYSLTMDLRERPEMRKLDRVHPFVMDHVLAAVRQTLPPSDRDRVQFQGTCDLTYDNQKFSGNSLRITRSHLLYHGTLLLDADLDRISNCLATAPRQPEYRAQRQHRDFITNLPVDARRLMDELARAFAASEPLESCPDERMRELSRERYSRDEWTHRH
ncbi:lipoate--protein ligase family protein [Roseimaritima ulvae]|uniref:Putative lipoate-protein ligase A n=1 Tax=Roseimaritima ulvae TaxID=980254 RepID=A0A5B9R2J4_9BACT|nr:lipoate--protein ligase family protein [Roseimaritima ulvae]QEG43636.1 putative lipoate-protein ligase A [Roseimaritima ulvae]